MNTYNYIKFIIIITAAFIFFSAYDNSKAQTDTTSHPVSLDGHKFIINSTLGSPFTNTTFKNILGAGQTMNLEIPPIVIRGRPVVQLQGEIVFTNLIFEYQQEIRDWLAFYGEVRLIGRLGTETGTLISQGVNLVTGYNLGWKFKVLETKKLKLATSLSISKLSYTSLDLPTFIQGIIDSGKVTPGNKLVGYTPLLRGGAAINAAYAFNKTFGAMARLYVDYGESAKRGESDLFNYNYGLAIDADLYPNHNIPLGFLFGFYHASLPTFRETNTRDPNELLLQINYTGKKYLNIGAEVNYRWYLPEKFDNYINFLTFNLTTSIYF